ICWLAPTTNWFSRIGWRGGNGTGKSWRKRVSPALEIRTFSTDGGTKKSSYDAWSTVPEPANLYARLTRGLKWVSDVARLYRSNRRPAFTVSALVNCIVSCT